MTPERAVALACDALGADPGGARVLRAADAITVLVDDRRVARVIPDDPAGTRRVLAGAAVLGSRILQPLAPPIAVADAVVVAYPRVHPGLDGRDDLAMGGACLADLHRRGGQALERDALDLPAFDPASLADRWLGRAPLVLLDAERDRLRAAIAEAWPAVTGPRTAIHADAHPANWWVASDDDWVLIDPEFLSLGPAVYDLAPLEVVERRLGTAPSRFASFRRGYEAWAGPVDQDALRAAIRVRELLAVAWLASRAVDDSAVALRVRARLDDALAGRDGTWLA